MHGSFTFCLYLNNAIITNTRPGNICPTNTNPLKSNGDHSANSGLANPNFAVDTGLTHTFAYSNQPCPDCDK
jgi:hypothetical protein